MKIRIRHWAVAIIAWACFVVSFFLPAFDQIAGWKSAILQNLFWQQATQGDPLATHYLLLTFANLVMLVSPFFIAQGVHDVGFVKWLRGLSTAATVLAWLFLAHLTSVHMGHDLRIGYYMWAASFVVLTVAALLQPIPMKTNRPETV